MAKAGLIQMTRSFAVERAADGICAGSVAPWFTRTPLTEERLAYLQTKELIEQRTPIGRIARTRWPLQSLSYVFPLLPTPPTNA
jgi:NAD(P)-dependent dehydrogenase (short-subunit alcohol dehydrogenase family)